MLTNEKRLCIGLIILVVVLVTASLFHTEFVYLASAETDKSLNIQVDDLPNWASFASNVMFDATKVWEDANPGLKFTQYNQLIKQISKYSG